jgi:hypothetical protein
MMNRNVLKTGNEWDIQNQVGYCETGGSMKKKIRNF